MTFFETLAVVGFPSSTSRRLATGAKRGESPLLKDTTITFLLLSSLTFPTFSYGISCTSVVKESREQDLKNFHVQNSI